MRVGETANDPLGDELARLAEGDSRRASVVVLHAKTAPDVHAERLRLAERLKVPAPAVVTDPEPFQRDAARAELDRLATTSPAVARWIESPDNYAVAKDDLETLEGMEGASQRFLQRHSDAPRSVAGGVVRDFLGSSTAGIGRLLDAQGRGMQTETYGDEGNEDDPVAALVGGLIVKPVGELLQGGGEKLKEWGAKLAPPVARQGTTSQILAGLGQVGGQVATGGAGSLGMLGQGADIAGTRAEAAGATQAQIDAAQEQGAVVTGLSEKLGMGLLMRKLPLWAQRTLRGRAADTVGAGIGEGTQEVVEGLGHDYIASQYDPTTEIGQGIAHDFTVAGAVGSLARIVLGAHPRIAQIDNSTRGADFLEEVGKLAQSSKVGQRSPAHLADLVDRLQEAGAPGQAYIGAQDFVQLFQSPAEAYAAAATYTGVESAEALDMALATNGDLVLPIGKAVQLLASKEGATAVGKMKIGADHLNVTEARAADREAEVDGFMAELEAVYQRTSADPETAAAEQDILGELISTGRYSPGDAQAMASLLPRLYSVLATRSNQTVAELRQRYPVAVLAASMGDRLRRSNPKAEDIRISAILEGIKTGKSPSMRDAYGPSLLDELVKAGGLKDDGGWLNNMDAGRARPGLINRTGMPLDQAAKWAREQGFFPPTDESKPDELESNDLLDLIDQDIRQNGVYRSIPIRPDLARLKEDIRAWEQELPSLLGADETMSDLLALSNEEILNRARKMAAAAYEEEALASASLFPESKARDASGRLLTMWHGGSFPGSGEFALPAFFTADKAAARSYFANVDLGTPRLTPVHLNITNPASEADVFQVLRELRAEEGGEDFVPYSDEEINEGIVAAFEFLTPGQQAASYEVIGMLQAKGFDGAHIRNDFYLDGNKMMESWVAFEPGQIASVDFPGTFFQTAYHGTHARGIDAFKTQKVGSGEGAQVYGWGLYFASSKGIAEWYRETVSAKHSPVVVRLRVPGTDTVQDVTSNDGELISLLINNGPNVPDDIDDEDSEEFFEDVMDVASLLETEIMTSGEIPVLAWPDMLVRTGRMHPRQTPYMLHFIHMLRNAGAKVSDDHKKPFIYESPEGDTRATAYELQGLFVDADEFAHLDDDDVETAASFLPEILKQQDHTQAIAALRITQAIKDALTAMVAQAKAWGIRYDPVARGQLYQVDVPEDSDLLDYGSVFAAQPQAVRERLAPVMDEIVRNNTWGVNISAVPGGLVTARVGTYEGHGDTVAEAKAEAFRKRAARMQGWEIYQHLVDLARQDTIGMIRAIGGNIPSAEQLASHRLMELGIPGLRYPDASSRDGSGKTSFNYVIWDDTRVAIQDTFYQDSKAAPPFRSTLLASIELGSGAPKKADAAGWAGWLDGAQRRGEFRQAERDYLGLKEWLAGNGTTTRQQLIDYVRAHQLVVSEVIEGEVKVPDTTDLPFKATPRDRTIAGVSHDVVGPTGAVMSVHRSQDEAEEAAYQYSSGYLRSQGRGQLPQVPSEFRMGRMSAQDVEDFGGTLGSWAMFEYDEDAANGLGELVIGAAPGLSYAEAVRSVVDEGADLTGGADMGFIATTAPYSTMVLPGGKGYRLMKLMLPTSDTKPSVVALRAEYEAFKRAFDPDNMEEVRRVFDLEGRLRAAEKGDFTGGHWSEPNVVAHVRFDIRTDSEGKLVFFVQEVQSDWHQKGKKYGYKGQPPRVKYPDQQGMADDVGWKVRAATDLERSNFGITDDRPIVHVTYKDGSVSLYNVTDIDRTLQDEWGKVKRDQFYSGNNAKLSEAEWAELSALVRDLDFDEGANGHNAVPDAPLKTTWHELAMKRIIRLAAERGFDRVAWATPAQVPVIEQWGMSLEEIRADEGASKRFGAILARYENDIPRFMKELAKKHGGVLVESDFLTPPAPDKHVPSQTDWKNAYREARQLLSAEADNVNQEDDYERVDNELRLAFEGVLDGDPDFDELPFLPHPRALVESLAADMRENGFEQTAPYLDRIAELMPTWATAEAWSVYWSDGSFNRAAPTEQQALVFARGIGGTVRPYVRTTQEPVAFPDFAPDGALWSSAFQGAEEFANGDEPVFAELQGLTVDGNPGYGIAIASQEGIYISLANDDSGLDPADGEIAGMLQWSDILALTDIGDSVPKTAVDAVALLQLVWNRPGFVAGFADPIMMSALSGRAIPAPPTPKKDRVLTANPAIEITPALRDAAMGGFSLFQSGAAYDAVVGAFNEYDAGPLPAHAFALRLKGAIEQYGINDTRLRSATQGFLQEFDAGGGSAQAGPLLMAEERLALAVADWLGENRVMDQGGEDTARGSITFPRSGVGEGGETLIRIAESADQSTFLHEMGHFYLEVLAAESARPGASPALAADFDRILSWFGVADRAAWSSMGLEAKRPFHEQFARGFERYLGEGKAPAPPLKGAFRKFKDWMLAVYKDLTNLRVDLTDDVRGVFDRLLATDDEISAAKLELGFVPLVLPDGAALGLTEAMLREHVAATEAARESLAARVLHAKFRETRSSYKAAVRAEVEALRPEVDVMPVYLTIATLRAAAGAPGAIKLSRGELVRKYGEGVLGRFRGMYAEDGVGLEQVADVLGWPGSEAMLNAILNAKPKQLFLKAEAQARVRERLGDPMTDGTITVLAMEALHNGRMAKALDAELAILSQLAGSAPPKPGALAEAARRIVAAQTGRSIQPHQHLVAERKAANEAAKAAAKGDFGKALGFKRQQAMSAALYVAAKQARKDMDRLETRAARLQKKPARERLAAAKGSYLEQVEAILGAYEFKPASGRTIRRRAALRTWVESLQADGEVTGISQALIDRVEAERVTNWRDVTVAELREVDEALANIEHLGKLKNRLLAGARKASKDQAIAEMTARITEVLDTRGPDVVDRSDLSRGERLLEQLRSLGDAITRPEWLIEALDGGETGPVHDFLWRAQVDAENQKIDLMRRVGLGLKALHETLPTDFMSSTNEMVVFKGVRMRRYTLISAAFNLGNAGNRQRLRDGGITTANGQVLRLADADLGALANLLTSTEARYVQGVWDVVDSLRPDIEALTKELGGIPVDFVTPLPLTIAAADGQRVELRGGYWPLVYHSERSAVGERQEGDDAMKILMQAGAARAATSKGHTKDRVEELSAALKLNFGEILTRSFDQVMTDLAYRKAVRDISMLLRDQEFKAFLIGRVGRSGYDAINGGLAYSVSAGADVAGLVAGGWRNAMDWTIANGVVSALAIRPDIALGNYASAIVQALNRTSRKWLLRGMRRLMLDRRDMTAVITGKSPMMRNRLEDTDHYYRAELKKTRDVDARQGQFKVAYFRVMMTLHRFADQEVSRMLWMGRYEQALADGSLEREAIELADTAVRMTQTAQGRKDKSTFERDPAFAQSRLFMGPMYIQFGTLLSAAKGQGKTRDVGARLSQLLIAWAFAPAVFALAAGRAPDDDDDDGEWSVSDWARWLGLEVALFPLQTIPFVRDLEAIAKAAVTGRPANPRASPLAQALGTVSRSVASLSRNIEDEEGDGIEYDTATSDLVTAASPFTGLPGSQYRKTTKGVEYLIDNPDTGVLTMTELLVYGKPVYTTPEKD